MEYSYWCQNSKKKIITVTHGNVSFHFSSSMRPRDSSLGETENQVTRPQSIKKQNQHFELYLSKEIAKEGPEEQQHHSPVTISQKNGSYWALFPAATWVGRVLSLPKLGALCSSRHCRLLGSIFMSYFFLGENHKRCGVAGNRCKKSVGILF